MTDDLARRRAAARPAERTPEEMQRLLESRITCRAIEDQPELAEPLSEAELRAGGGWLPAITSTDMTPRPRYRETQAAFEARMAAMGHQLSTLGQEVKQRNRDAAVRHVALANGYERWWTVCSCGFCGLRVEDPELARREYDAHACAAAGVGQAAVDRAIAETGRNTLAKRTTSVLKPTVVTPAEAVVAPTTAVSADDAELRFQLLELK